VSRVQTAIPGPEPAIYQELELLLPASFDQKRQQTAETLLNLLEGKISNPNTRQAYKNAWRQFFLFCSEYKLELDRIRPYHFNLWRNHHTGSLATQRQHLAAIRRLFDHLLENGLLNVNPAARATVDRLNRETSHTPVFEHAEMSQFLNSIRPDSLIAIRDKALFSTMAYSWARVSAIVGLTVEDYYMRDTARWIRLKEKRGKIHEVPVHSDAAGAIDHWLSASGLDSTPSMPLFPSFTHNRRFILNKHMTRMNVWKLVRTRAKAIGLEKNIGCHSFRSTGLTAYMNAGGDIAMAQRIAGHSQAATTKLYDRSKDRLTIKEIEKISFNTVSPAPSIPTGQ
jgi:integrase/recombinase XerD